MLSLRSTYVSVARGARDAARHLGLLDPLEASDRPTLRHLRTMLAIHDPKDLSALDVPWWTYGAIREVDRFLARRRDARVFEFGAGASTLWLARRASAVYSVEHDPCFAAIVREMLKATDGTRAAVELHEVPAPPAGPERARVASGRRGAEGLDFHDYVATIDRVGGRFDLVVIDGRARLECLCRAIPHLTEDSLVVFDDVGRRRYHPALHVPGPDAQVFRGATPCLPYPTSTALLRRQDAG